MNSESRKKAFQKFAVTAEIVTSLAVIISLIILIQEVRLNTSVQQRQVQLERSLNYTDKFLDPSATAEIWAKVKAIDGLEPLANEYVERYQLTPSEAVVWSRLVLRTLFIWNSDFLFDGPSESLKRDIAIIPTYPDLELAFRLNEDEMLSPEFVSWAEALLEENP